MTWFEPDIGGVIGTKQTERRELWRQRIAGQESSGKTVREYCRERQLGQHAFYYWRKQLQGASEKPVRFALVEASQSQLAAPLELVLSSGERLLIPADAGTLELVLKVLHKHA